MGIARSATILTLGVVAVVVAAVTGAGVVPAADGGFLLDLIGTVSTWLPLPAVTGDGLIELAGGLLPGIPLFAVQVIVLFLSLYIFILRGDRLETDLRRVIPERFGPALDRIERAMADTLHSLYIANGATALVAFVLAIPLFALLGYGHALLFSLLVAVSVLVPVVGAAVVMAVLVLYAVARGDVWQAVLIGAVIFPFIAGICDGYLRTRLHPVALFVGFLGGMVSMGLFGLIIGPILVAVLMVVLPELLSGDRIPAGGASPAGKGVFK